MRVRGERECQSCGTRWTYYETGSVECPECGSLRSVGVDDRTQHTNAADELDLSGARNALEDEPLHRVASQARDAATEYVRQRGFIDAGDLRPLDDGYLAAAELRHVADAFERSFQPDDDEELYFLELLRTADADERPDSDVVPASMRSARGLAYAESVRSFRRELRDWEGGDTAEIAGDLDRLESHVRRVRTLEGDVPLADAERLVTAARELATYVVEDDEGALARARERLDRLEDL
jgi:uncharacterized Zn finger protein (UPF0148 family)